MENTNERKLIFQNDKLFSTILNDRYQYQKNFEAVAKAFLELGIGPITEEVYGQIVTDKARDIYAPYYEQLNKELDRTGVTNKVLRNTVLQGAEEPLREYHQAVDAFLSTDVTKDNYGRSKDREKYAFLEISDLTFLDGELIVSDDTKEDLLDKYCRVYVTTDEEYQLYNTLLLAKTAIQNFRSMAISLGFKMSMRVYGQDDIFINHPSSLIDDFFTATSETEISIKASSIPWAIGYKSAQEARNNAGKR